MKKILLAALAVAVIAVGTFLLLPKEMPAEGLLLDGKAPGETLQTEIDVPGRYLLTLPVENAVVTEVELTGEDGTAVLLSDKTGVQITRQNTQETLLKLTLSAKGYRDAVYSWPVEVLLHSQEVTLQHPQGEALEAQSMITLAEDDEDYMIAVASSAEGASFTPDTTKANGVAEAVVDTDPATGLATLRLSPKAAGTGTITVAAAADNYQDQTISFAIEVLPRLQVTADKMQLKLKVGETGTVTLSANAPGVRYEVKTITGDAKAEVKDHLLTVTAQKAVSKILVSAQADGYAPAKLEVAVSVQAQQAQQAEQNQQEQQNQQNQQDRPTQPSDQNIKVPQADTSGYDKVISEIISATNAQRSAAGLAPLRHVKAVDTPAMIRAKEVDQLWSHTRPDGSNFNTVFGQVGLSYPGVGENLFSANSFLSAQQVVGYWMESPGHRSNILNEQWTGIGIGVYEGAENTYWVQLFVKE